MILIARTNMVIGQETVAHIGAHSHRRKVAVLDGSNGVFC
jgi:hypothetical protein